MKKEIINKFELKLEFNKDTEDPSRLFRSFADLIDGIKELDTTLAKTINTSISSKIYLNDIEKGSLIGKLWNHLIINDDNKLDDNKITKKTINDFIDESRSKSIEFIESGKSEVEDLKGLAKNIDEIANEKGIKDTFNAQIINYLDLLSGNIPFLVKKTLKELEEL